jgi:natural product precursor
MKKTFSIAKLKLSRETLSNLDDSELKRVDGGLTVSPCSFPCHTASCYNQSICVCE